MSTRSLESVSPAEQSPELGASGLPTAQTTVEFHRQAVERAIVYMRAHLSEPPNLNTLCGVAAMSKFHLIRVFESLTGISPHLYLAALRIQKAKELLLTSELSITEVCMEVGYSSLGTFSRIFRTLVGLSPNALRESARQYTTEDMYRAGLEFSRRQRVGAKAALEGEVQGESNGRGMIFVGAFPKAVPQGKPLSGTILLGPGPFRFQRPARDRFFLLCLLLPFDFAPFGPLLKDIDRIRVAAASPTEAGSALPPLVLRRVQATDPPLVVALPTLLA